LRHAATIFGACQAKLFAQYPKEWRIRFHPDIHDAAIHIEFCHLRPRLLLWLTLRCSSGNGLPGFSVFRLPDLTKAQ
jgi:hypothetical protein